VVSHTEARVDEQGMGRLRGAARVVLAAGCAVLMVGACGGDDDDDDAQIEVGGCIVEDGDGNIEPVSCDSEEAEAVLVYDIAPEAQYSCDDGLKKLVYGQVLNDSPTGVQNAYCVGTPGELTNAQQERLDEEIAEEADNADP
jgi:hypothetical protein